jgi:hypothetical protein
MAAWGGLSLFKGPVLGLEALRKLSAIEFLRIQPDVAQLKNKIKGLGEFISSHCAELLSYAFVDRDDELGEKSFALLSLSSKKVASALLVEDLFFLKATEVLLPGRVSAVLLRRLSALFTVLVENAPSPAALSESVGFLLHLLKYIEEPSVFSLFISICNGPAALSTLQSLLADSGLCTFVLDELQGNLSTDKTVNLLSIICVCLKSPVLRANFTNSRVIDCLR